MDSELDRVRRAALEQAAASNSLEDLEKAANVAKALAEADRSASETRNAARQFHLQWISAAATILIPLVSLLALFGTIFFQTQQLRETRQQNSFQAASLRQENEDKEWRDLLNSLRGPAEDFDTDVTAAPRLRSFFTSARYSGQAMDIAVHLMGRLTNPGGFKDLYRVVFPDLTPAAFAQILDVARTLKQTRINIETECSNLSLQYKLSNFGICTLNKPVAALSLAIDAPFPPRAIQLRQGLAGIYANMLFISQAIAQYLQQHYSVQTAGGPAELPVDMSKIDVFNADFSGVDFRKIDMQGIIFWDTKFTGADLRPVSALDTTWNVSNWWDARAIDQTLLDRLIRFQFPFWNKDAIFALLAPPSEDSYRARIAALCRPAIPACAPEALRYK